MRRISDETREARACATERGELRSTAGKLKHAPPMPLGFWGVWATTEVTYVAR
jgi:hypothetical protein